MDLDVGFGGAFIAGLLSFASPCVLPIVPPYLCFLAGVSAEQLSAESETDKAIVRRIIVTAFAFVLGFTTVFVALGATASVLGQLVTDYFDILAKVAGALIILLGLHFTGLLKITALYRDIRVHVENRPAGVIGAYVIGLAFAFGWTPCVGPVLATILMVAGAEDSVSHGALLLGAYALGIGIPFLLAAGFAPQFLRLMRRFRRHIGTIEKIIGVLLIATGILFLTGSIPEISFWLLETFPSLGTVG